MPGSPLAPEAAPSMAAPTLLCDLGRMGYREYTVPPRSFEMMRPVLDPDR